MIEKLLHSCLLSRVVGVRGFMTINSSILPRILPFTVFMAFIGLEEGAQTIAKSYSFAEPANLLLIYPIKVFLVMLIIALLWKRYDEIKVEDLGRFSHTMLSVIVGFTVFILWINMNWKFGTIGEPKGYDPTVIASKELKLTLICIRIFGAAAVVPIMEELFWRSFLLRYIVDDNFTKLPIGTFTWMSFTITTVMFGLEHNFFIAGMMAGCIYNLLLYYTKSVSQCVLAHSVTNLLLGLYVVYTGKWFFW